MPYRKILLVEEKIYHVFTKSIAGFKIFNSDRDFDRMLNTLIFYMAKETPCKFSLFLKRAEKDGDISQVSYPDKMVNILAYCLMPTHIHLIMQQLRDNGISRYLNLILKSYSKYFNIKYERKGPLWEGRFKNVLVETDEQFLHLSRYLHLNPVSASLISDPKDWRYSSYGEYIGLVHKNNSVCDFANYFNMDIPTYQKFVKDHIPYQKELSKIKHLILG